MIEIDPENPQEKKHPERPLECYECKKPIAVHYSEIVGPNCVITGMCQDCPELKKKLKGLSPAEIAGTHAEGMGLACGECGTTLEAIRHGNPLGCCHCYEIFDDIVLSELLAAEKIPARIANNRKSVLIHIGRSPGETKEISPTLRLLALNEALKETLKREDYEQAAWLRDQIKALTEENGGSNERE